MAVTLGLIILVFGVGTTFWSLVGVGRAVAARRRESGRQHRHSSTAVHGARVDRPTADQVAVLVAAHNEELVIEETIRAAASLVPTANIHVISDGSSDATAELARAGGANVLELNPNRGKAGALAAGIEYFELCDRFDIVMLLDADTHLSPDYLTTGLPLFAEPDVVAVAGRAETIARPRPLTGLGRFLVAYRERLYVIVQLLLKFGQAAKWANAVTIVPGFASMYRTTALKQIDVVGAGLVIEDFNMTFEVHRKKLGRIEFHPGAAVAYTQDPDRFDEYVRQVRRWILGFWQTVRRHGLHPGVFWIALAVFVVELLLSCVALVLLLPLFVVSFAAHVWVSAVADPAGWAVWLGGLVTPHDVLVGVLLPDYLLSVIAAVALRQPRYAWIGVGFFLMRIVDAWICLSVLPRAWVGRSSGVWASPTRRAGAKSAAAALHPVHAYPLPLAQPVLAGTAGTALADRRGLRMVPRPTGDPMPPQQRSSRQLAVRRTKLPPKHLRRPSR